MKICKRRTIVATLILKISSLNVILLRRLFHFNLFMCVKNMNVENLSICALKNMILFNTKLN